MVKYSEVAGKLAGQVEAVCEKLLPGGTKKGQYYCASNVYGGKGDSLKVNLTGNFQGKWRDFNGNDHGDLIDLWAHSCSLELCDAYEEACKWLNITQPSFVTVKKQFEAPQSKEISISDGAIKYLNEIRKIPVEIIKQFQVGSNPGELIFQYFRDFKLVNIKTLSMKRDSNGKKQGMRFEKGCEQCLYGWDAYGSLGRSITICEGEIDAMSLASYGIKALSVPTGASGTSWIENEFDRIDRFDKIYLCFDNDDAGQKGALAHAHRLGIERCYNVKLPKKDANECLVNDISKQEIKLAFDEAASFDPEQLQNPLSFLDKVLDKIFPDSLDNLGYDSPWNWFNKKIFFDKSGLSVWTGTNGHGKTQFLNHLSIHWMTKGAKVCIASLELDPDETIINMIPVLSAQNVNPRLGSTITKDYAIECVKWLNNGKLWFYDEFGGAQASELLAVLEYAHRKYGIDIFVIDSLSLINIDDDNYSQQANFVKELVRFKKRNNCHVHLVVHPKKLESESKMPGKFDFKGSGTITNIADNCFSVFRNKDKEINKDLFERGEKLDSNALESLDLPDCFVYCMKQRKGGHEGKFGYWLDLKSKQYWESENIQSRAYVNYSKKDQ